MTEEVRKIPLFSFELSDYAKGFLEAAIDGEGSIILQRHKRRGRGICFNPIVSISNLSKEWLKIIQELADNGRISDGSATKIYEYRMSWNGMREVLPQLGLVIKERQRVLLIEALELLSKRAHYKSKTKSEWWIASQKRLEEIAEEIKRLNHTCPK